MLYTKTLEIGGIMLTHNKLESGEYLTKLISLLCFIFFPLETANVLGLKFKILPFTHPKTPNSPLFDTSIVFAGKSKIYFYFNFFYVISHNANI